MDCLPIRLSYPSFLCSFSFFHFLVVGSVRRIKLTYVSFWAHVKIASRIISYRIWDSFVTSVRWCRATASDVVVGGCAWEGMRGSCRVPARPPRCQCVADCNMSLRYGTVRRVSVNSRYSPTNRPSERRSVTRRPATVILYIFTRTHRIRFTLCPANSRFLVVTSHCLYFVYFSTYLGLVLGSLWTLSEPCWSCTLTFVTVILLAFTNKWLIDWLIDRLWRFCLSLTLSVLDF